MVKNELLNKLYIQYCTYVVSQNGLEPMQLAQLGKHIKVTELLAEKYKCQVQLELLSAQVQYQFAHPCINYTLPCTYSTYIS